MQLYESRLSYFNDKARINYCKPPSVYQHSGPTRPLQNCHSRIFETKENSNRRIYIRHLGHHSKTTCQKSAKSMRYRVRPKFEFYRKSLLNEETRFRINVCSRKIFTNGTFSFFLRQFSNRGIDGLTLKSGGVLRSADLRSLWGVASPSVAAPFPTGL